MSELKPLWPNGHQLALISVSGEHEAGKTLFGLMVCPESVCVIDTEKSAEPYETAFKLKRIGKLDGIATCETNARIDLNAIAGVTASLVSRAKAFAEIIRQIPAGRWRVIVLDVLTDVETALTEHVNTSPLEFNLNPAQIQRSTALVWSAVKQYEKRLLLQLMDKAECVVVCRHMRAKFAGGRPTMEREAKGLDSIDELSSLSVELRRPVDRKGEKSPQPCGLVGKSRLVEAQLIDGKLAMVPSLPPRLPECTPDAIREYILNPPDPNKLKKGEKAEPTELTDDQKLMLQASIAADQRAAAEAAQVVPVVAPEPLPAPNLKGDVGTKAEAKAKPPIKQPEPMKKVNGSLGESLLAEISRRKKALEITDADWQGLLERFDAPMDQNTSRRSAVLMDPADQNRLAEYLAAQLEGNERQAKREEMAAFAGN